MTQSHDPRDIQLISTDSSVIQLIQNQFQNVLKVLVDPDLQPLRSRIQLLYNNFREQGDLQKGYLTKCTELKKDKDLFLNRISNANKMEEDENAMAENYKKELEKKEIETEELRRKESDVKDVVAKHKNRLRELDLDEIKFREDIQLQNESEENELKKELEVLKKTYDESLSKLLSFRSQENTSSEEITELRSNRDKLNKKIDVLSLQIQQIQSLEKKEKFNKEKKKEELDQKKLRKDQLRYQKGQLQQRIKKLQQDIIECSQNLRNEKKRKDDQIRTNNKLEKQKQQLEREQKRKKEEFELKEGDKKEKLLELEVLKRQHQIAIENESKSIKACEFAFNKKNEMQVLAEGVVNKKQEISKQFELEREALELLKIQKEKVKLELNEQISKRVQSDKEYKASENKEHLVEEGVIQLHNRLKKIMNEVASYQAESQKLAKMVQQLKKQQQKYGIEASHAHAKYYRTIQEVKIKNTQIQNLQKENLEVEKKSKHQQKLYETVRSDRNLYSGIFDKSKKEITELKKKYKRMTYEVEQLREEIKNKDQKLVEHDKEFRKIEAENLKIKEDKTRAVKKIESNMEVIKNQENHIANMKKIIQEGETTKFSQEKDYEMVVNQRDILGTQLIKRNQEVAALYEKIKLSSSNLTKGELHYKKLQKQYNQLQRELAQLRNQHSATEDQVKCIEELKDEVSYKEKELLNERAKVRALEDELANPMNVHRWRKIEATDQQKYEKILKIQTLQRRLISKTEEVESKGELIREKEKLFLDLKNILSRQPGSEIQQQLTYYKETLKDKASHMKKMKKELEDAYEEVAGLKFEVDRLNNVMTSLKNQYFQVRAESEKEVIEEDKNFADQVMKAQEDMHRIDAMMGLTPGVE